MSDTEGQSDSFFTLFYTGDPGLWDEHVGPERSLESWLQKDRRCELALTSQTKSGWSTSASCKVITGPRSTGIAFWCGI